MKKQQKFQSFYDEMIERQLKAIEGDTACYPAALQSRINNAHPDKIEVAARIQAMADPSDPFAYRRCKSFLQNGVAKFSDYHAKFARGTTTSRFDPNKIIPTRVPIERRMP